MSQRTVSHDDLYQRALEVINKANQTLEGCRKDISLLRFEKAKRDYLLQNAKRTRALLSIQQTELNLLIQQKLESHASDQSVY